MVDSDSSGGVPGSCNMSEEFGQQCQPCYRANQPADMAGYCQDCGEYLCEMCIRYHERSLVSMKHVVVARTNLQPTLPKESKDSTEPPPIPPRPTRKDNDAGIRWQPNDKLERQCDKHTDEIIKYYCQEHSSLACNECVRTDHKTCEDVSYIPNLSKESKDSEQFRVIFDSLKKLQATLSFEFNRAKYNETNIEETYRKMLKGIQQLRDDMIKLMDDLYANTEKDLNEIISQERKKRTVWLKGFNGLRPDIDQLIESARENEKKGYYNNLFVDIKAIKEELPELKELVETCSENNKPTFYTFEKNSLLKQLASLKSLGRFRGSSVSSDIRVIPAGNLNLKSENDTRNCKIFAVACLQKGDLVISDNQNRSIKVILPAENKISARVVLDSEPFDLTLVDKDLLAVALPNVRCIELLTVSATALTRLRLLKVDAVCLGLESVDSTLIAACQNPICLRQFDLHGNVLRTFGKDHRDQPLFAEPSSIALSPDKGVAYVTDWQRRCVITMTTGGEKLATFDSGELPQNIGNPVGMACDSRGFVYVCYGDTNSVHLLEPNGEYLKELMDGTTGLYCPFSIAIDKASDRLYIGSFTESGNHANELRVFQLEYKDAETFQE